jgi:hypothetical protein
VLAYAINPENFTHPKVIDPSVGAGSKLHNDQIRNTIVKNGPKNPVSPVTLPLGFPADFENGVVLARQTAWPTYVHDIKVENNKTLSPVEAVSGWSSKNLLIAFINNQFQSISDSKGQKTRFVLTHTGAIESIKEREQASHVTSVIGGVGTTQSQSAELSEMGFSFPFPKPVDLVKYLISMHSDSSGLILDSFGGSGTTAHAVLKQNAEDGGTRRFILVEMDAGIATDVTAERVRRVAKGYVNSKGVAVDGLVPAGGFQFCRLSAEPLFTAEGQIRADVKFAQLAEFVWFAETGTGYSGKADSSLLGIYEGRAIYLLYNGILKDKSIGGGNVLTGPVFDILPKRTGAKTIYAAANRMGARSARLGILFKQTPYALDV